jgi:hypothetical protein
MERQNRPGNVARCAQAPTLSVSSTQEVPMASNDSGSRKPQPGEWQEVSPPDRRTIRMEMPDGRVLTDFTPKIIEHMTVYSRDNDVAGEVDEIEPDSKAIKLSRDATGHNHWIPMDLVIDVDTDGVHLNATLEEMRHEWSDEPPS